jgi:hypothetical protein
MPILQFRLFKQLIFASVILEPYFVQSNFVALDFTLPNKKAIVMG